MPHLKVCTEAKTLSILKNLGIHGTSWQWLLPTCKVGQMRWCGGDPHATALCSLHSCPTRVSTWTASVLPLNSISWWGHILMLVFKSLLCWRHSIYLLLSSAVMFPLRSQHVWETSHDSWSAENESQQHWTAGHPKWFIPMSGSCDTTTPWSQLWSLHWHAHVDFSF